MSLERAQLATINIGWLKWFDDVDQLFDVLEPVLEMLVEIRNASWWLKLPFLRKLRPPQEVEQALTIVRALREQLS